MVLKPDCEFVILIEGLIVNVLVCEEDTEGVDELIGLFVVLTQTVFDANSDGDIV